MIEAVELLSAQPPRFKVVPTPDHGTRLVPVDPTPPGSHTPGPWELRGCRLVTDHHGVVIAERISANGPGTPEANARLIAAAPELLELAKFMVLNIGGYDPEKARDMARAAIAKATGGAK